MRPRPPTCGFVAVARARPEDPRIRPCDCGHHVHVEVRHALLTGVHRDERARRAQAARLPAEALHFGEQGLEQLAGKVDQRLVVLARNDERVAVEDGGSIEECDGVLGPGHDHDVGSPLHDIAESAPRCPHGPRS